MVRKYDKYGLNRQFKRNPCSRRDPFPRDHLPFVDDMSNKKTLDDAIKASKGSSARERLNRAKEEGKKIKDELRKATQKMREQAKKTGRGLKKGIKKAAHSKFEQYAMEAAGFGLDFLAAAILFGSEGAAAPLAEMVAEEGIELQGVAAAEMAGEGAAVAAGEGEAVDEGASLLGRQVRRRTTRSGREY